MAIDKKIEKELSMVRNLQKLTVVYEEIAVRRINATKSSVLSTREFLSKLAHVFYTMKYSYKQEIDTAIAKNKKTMQKAIQKDTKKKEVHVLLSANSKMYGDIVAEVYRTFIDKTKNVSADITILGAVGKSLYDDYSQKKPYIFFDIADEVNDLSQIQTLVKHLLNYEKVIIYYGKFTSVLKQVPAIIDISGDVPFEEVTDAPQEPINTKERFLFEPSLTSIIDVFEIQIFFSLLKQTLHEVELARFASRIKAMEQTNENINDSLKELKKRELRVKYLRKNKRQLQELANIMYYQKRRHIDE